MAGLWSRRCLVLLIRYQYEWFLCLIFSTVENESHCDFTKLREMLIRTNMEDMREVTHLKHFELYRKKILEQVRKHHPTSSLNGVLCAPFLLLLFGGL